MIDSQNKGLPFPKGAFKKKINGQTEFDIQSETATLPASANWNSSLFGLQLQYLPALANEAIGQTIADPVVNCVTDSNTRTVSYKRPTGSEPATGQVYLDLFTGIIQFNSADAGKQFQVTYYRKASLVDHNAMNRIWESGHTWIVGDSAHHDYSDLQACITAASNGDTIKVVKNITTTGITVDKKLRINFNNKSLIKSGTATSSRGFLTSEDLTLEECVFSGWDESGDVCVYVSADKLITLFKNNAIGQTQFTNASSVCTNCIVQGNLPLTSNVGLATGTSVSVKDTSNVVSGTASTLEFPDGSLTNMGSGVFKVAPKGPYVSKVFICSEALSVGDPLYYDTATSKVKKFFGGTTNSRQNQLIGFAMNATSADGENVEVGLWGVLSLFSGLTAGTTYFLSSSTHTLITKSYNNGIYKVGTALDASTVFFCNENKKSPTAESNTALNGDALDSGTPSRETTTIQYFSGHVKCRFLTTDIGNTGDPARLVFTGVPSNCYVDITLEDSSANVLDTWRIYPWSTTCTVPLKDVCLVNRNLAQIYKIKFTATNISTGTVSVGAGTIEVEGY